MAQPGLHSATYMVRRKVGKSGAKRKRKKNTMAGRACATLPPPKDRLPGDQTAQAKWPGVRTQHSEITARSWMGRFLEGDAAQRGAVHGMWKPHWWHWPDCPAAPKCDLCPTNPSNRQDTPGTCPCTMNPQCTPLLTPPRDPLWQWRGQGQAQAGLAGVRDRALCGRRWQLGECTWSGEDRVRQCWTRPALWWNRDQATIPTAFGKREVAGDCLLTAKPDPPWHMKGQMSETGLSE